MKYDSSMTHFHKDILAALQYMLKDDSEITEKFSPKDGSPAPLRDYLKQKYGKSRASHIGNGMRYSCNFSKGFELTFNPIINNSDYKYLTLSWSQTAKFIRDNWDEVFKKSETEEIPPSPQISYIDKLRERYPKVTETDDWFDGTYCPAELFVGKNVFDYGGEKCNYPDEFACQKCWREQCPEKISFIENEDFEKEYFEHYPDEEASEAVPEEEKSEPDDPSENQLIPQNAGEISETFNYAVLSAEMGDFLKRKEQQLKNEYMNFTANCGAIFAEVQEKLAKDGHGTFIKWIEAMGFKKDTVYRMIDVNKFRLSLIAKDENGTQEIFDALPKYLQYDISKPSAPAELVEQVLNGDITTHKDYIALKKQLDEANKRVEISEASEKRVLDNYVTLDQAYAARFNELANEQQKNKDLEKRVKELESRPVDVAVQQDAELLEELEELREENARLKDDSVKSMVIRLTLDEYDKLLEKLGGDPCLGHIIKHAKIIKL